MKARISPFAQLSAISLFLAGLTGPVGIIFIGTAPLVRLWLSEVGDSPFEAGTVPASESGKIIISKSG